MSPPTLLPLLRGRKISLEDALKSDADMLNQLKWPNEMLEFCFYLHSHLSEIKDIVSRHLNIPCSDFSLGEFREWRHGSFNTCVPIRINNGHPKLPRQAIIRFPQPFKVGEAFNPGNVDEKLRSEAATYIWLKRNCPEIPIPRLFAMGFPGAQSFTLLENESLLNCLIWYFRRVWTRRALSPYFSHCRSTLLTVGYLIIEHVEGDMLSETWEQHRHDKNRRAHLFRGLSQALVALARVPLPKIGSWTIDNRGVLSLTNRPLAQIFYEVESHNIPTYIPRDRTYSSVEPWVLDMLACQDNRLRYQPNAIHDDIDGRWQLSALTGLRALLPNFVNRQTREDPFVLCLTDVHTSNIFVNDDWRITSIIDLEFSSVLPIQMVTAPAWLTSRGIDQLTDPYLEEYETMYEEFVTAVDHEETKHASQSRDVSYSQTLRKAWSTGSLWYSHAISSLDAFPALFHTHILPRFAEPLHTEAESTLMKLWSEDTTKFIADKVSEQERYNTQLQELFAAARDEEAD